MNYKFNIGEKITFDPATDQGRVIITLLNQLQLPDIGIVNAQSLEHGLKSYTVKFSDNHILYDILENTLMRLN